jgi:hypothetical protein
VRGPDGLIAGPDVVVALGAQRAELRERAEPSHQYIALLVRGGQRAVTAVAIRDRHCDQTEPLAQDALDRFEDRDS